MMGSNASDEPTMSWIIVCAILYVLSGVTQVSFILYVICMQCVYSMYKSAYMSFLTPYSNYYEHSQS